MSVWCCQTYLHQPQLLYQGDGSLVTDLVHVDHSKSYQLIDDVYVYIRYVNRRSKILSRRNIEALMYYDMWVYRSYDGVHLARTPYQDMQNVLDILASVNSMHMTADELMDCIISSEPMSESSDYESYSSCESHGDGEMDLDPQWR